MSKFDSVQQDDGTEGRFSSVCFVGRLGPLVSVVLMNTLLNIITFGIYRFWAKSRIRRYFWNHVRIAGDPVEYVGLGKELFIGFLIALAVLVPLISLYQIILVLLLGLPEWVQSIWSLIYAVLIFSLIQVAIFRMFRYRLTRTIWRGIQFGLDGSTMRFVLLALGWTGVAIISLGLAVPWMRVALMRYRIRNARFGSSKFDFNGSGKALIGIWLINYALLGAVLVSLLTYPPIAILFVVAVLFTFTIFRVREFRYFISATSITGVKFESLAETGKVFKMFVLTQLIILLGIVLLGVLVIGIGAAVVQNLGILESVSTTSNWLDEFGDLSDLEAGKKVIEVISAGGGVLALTSIVGLLTFLFFKRVVTTVVLQHPLMVHICSTLTIINPSKLDQIVRSNEAVPRFGEGFADAFDVG